MEFSLRYGRTDGTKSDEAGRKTEKSDYDSCLAGPPSDEQKK